VSTSVLECYVAGSVTRWRQISGPGQPEADHPGLHGFLGCDADTRARLLATDDRALASLLRLGVADRSGNVAVFAGAVRCVELLAGDRRWVASSSTAMACRDLAAVPHLTLIDELALRPIRRTNEDAPTGVALERAVDAVLLADPGEEPNGLASFLRSLPGVVELFAAVDSVGTVRATAGWQLSGTDARVLLVDTDPAWRARGIATTMTSIALHAARAAGARTATLDASLAARPLYRRLGFESVSDQLRFRRVP
jgi:ribosomal protein S18 acetylase RimI-like enzyme